LGTRELGRVIANRLQRRNNTSLIPVLPALNPASHQSELGLSPLRPISLAVACPSSPHGFCNLAIGQVHLRYYFHFRALRFGGSDFVAPAFFLTGMKLVLSAPSVESPRVHVIVSSPPTTVTIHSPSCVEWWYHQGGQEGVFHGKSASHFHDHCICFSAETISPVPPRSQLAFSS
jgi:hypothetical protein